MPAEQLDDHDIDRALRALLPEFDDGDDGWLIEQRHALMTSIVPAFDAPPPARRHRVLLVAASTVVLVAAGLLVLARQRDDTTTPIAGSPTPTASTPGAATPTSGQPETSAAPTAPSDEVRVPPLVGLTEGQARSQVDDAGLTVLVTYRELPPGDPQDGTVVESPPGGSSVTAGSSIEIVVGRAEVPHSLPTPPMEPDLFPVVGATNPRAAEATAMWGGVVAIENPASATALVGRDDGSAITDSIELTVAATLDIAQYGDATDQETAIVADTELLVFTSDEWPWKTVVSAQEPVLIARGADPVAFLEAAGGFPVTRLSVDDGEVSFELGTLPEGYTVVTPPQRLARGSVNAITSLPGGFGEGIWAVVDVQDPRPVYGPGGPLTKTEVLGQPAWANGSTLMWQVSDATWVTISGATSLDVALDFAATLTFVDEATWIDTYAVQDTSVAPPG